MNALRTKTTEALKTLAKTHNVLTGKWLLFALPEDVDRIWGLVAKDTAEGKLGCAAKVATDEGQGERVPRVICVYTRDFLDVEDVRRVGWGLKDLGLVGVRGVWYKCGTLNFLTFNSWTFFWGCTNVV